MSFPSPSPWLSSEKRSNGLMSSPLCSLHLSACFFVSTYTATQIIGSLKLLLPLTDWTLLYRGLGKRRYPITFRSACLPPTPICCHLSGGGGTWFWQVPDPASAWVCLGELTQELSPPPPSLACAVGNWQWSLTVSLSRDGGGRTQEWIIGLSKDITGFVDRQLS